MWDSVTSHHPGVTALSSCSPDSDFNSLSSLALLWNSSPSPQISFLMIRTLSLTVHHESELLPSCLKLSTNQPNSFCPSTRSFEHTGSFLAQDILISPLLWRLVGVPCLCCWLCFCAKHRHPFARPSFTGLHSSASQRGVGGMLVALYESRQSGQIIKEPWCDSVTPVFLPWCGKRFVPVGNSCFILSSWAQHRGT